MPAPPPIIDVNITLGHWPMRRVPCDDLATLVAKLKSHNVIEAWAGSYDGLFHDDITAANNQLADTCRSITEIRLRPFGEINPLAPNWEAELNRCVKLHHMLGMRLHPNYHGYALDDPAFVQLLKAATEQKLIVQVVAQMEDARMMHPLLQTPPVDLAPLANVVASVSGVRLILLNALAANVRNDKLYRLLEAGEVYVEIAMLEGVAGIEELLKFVPLERILFGSHAPSFYFEAAALKLQESRIPINLINSVTHESARRLSTT